MLLCLLIDFPNYLPLSLTTMIRSPSLAVVHSNLVMVHARGCTYVFCTQALDHSVHWAAHTLVVVFTCSWLHGTKHLPSVTGLGVQTTMSEELYLVYAGSTRAQTSPLACKSGTLQCQSLLPGCPIITWMGWRRLIYTGQCLGLFLVLWGPYSAEDLRRISHNLCVMSQDLGTLFFVLILLPIQSNTA